MNDKALSRDDVLRELRLRKDHWQNRYGVVRIGVFGSMARGEAGGENDVDVVVQMAPNLFLRSALKAELSDLLGMPVDVVRYRKGMNKGLKKRIDQEAHYV
jgi:predicted nucleotidyltransferase